MAAPRRDESKEENYLSQKYQELSVRNLFSVFIANLKVYAQERMPKKTDKDQKEKKEEKKIEEKVTAVPKEQVIRLSQVMDEIKKDYEPLSIPQKKAKREEMSAKLGLSLANELEHLQTEFIKTLSGKERTKKPIEEILNEVKQLTAVVMQIKKEKIDVPAGHKALFGNPELIDKCNEIILTCNDCIDFLKLAVDFSISLAYVPKSWDKKESNVKNLLHYKRGEAILKTTAAIGLFSNPIGWLVLGGATVLSDGKALEAAGGAAVSFIKNYCYTTKENIPGEWIAGILDFSSTDKKSEEESQLALKNANYKKESDTVPIYIVEGLDPQQLFKKGTDHAGEHRHVAFFHNLNDAKLFILDRHSGQMWDKYGGHRRHKDWEPKTREESRLAHASQSRQEHKSSPKM